MATRPRKKSKVPLYGNPTRAAFMEDGATVGATVGLDLWMADGSLATAATLAAFIGAAASGASSGSGVGGLSSTLWSLIAEIPENVLQVAALATSGLVVRQADGDWITRAIAVASTDRLTITNGDGDAGAPTLDLADLEGLSVWGNAAISTAKPDAITGTANQVLRVNSAGTALAFGQVNLASSAAVTGRLAFANLAQITGPAVLGVSGAGAGDLASIAAAADDRVLARTAGSLAFVQLTVGMAPNSLWTYAKIQNATALSVLGRASGSSGVLADIAAGADDRLLSRTSSALAFTQLTSGMFPALVVPDAALSSNVPLKNAANAFTANQSIDSSNNELLRLAAPAGASKISYVAYVGTDAASASKTWYTGVNPFAVDGSFEIANAGVGSIIKVTYAGAVTLNGVNATDFARLSVANTFADGQKISGSGIGSLLLQDATAGTNIKLWRLYSSAGSFGIQTRTDVNGAGANPVTMTRTGTAVDSLAVVAATVTIAASTVVAATTPESRLLAANPFLSFYNAAGSTRFGYLQIDGSNGALLSSGVVDLIQLLNGQVRQTGDAAFYAFFNSGNTTRRGYLQMVTGGEVYLVGEEASQGLRLVTNGGRMGFSVDNNASFAAVVSTGGAFQSCGTFGSGFYPVQGVELGVSAGDGIVQSFDRGASAYKPLVFTGSSVKIALSGGASLTVATQQSDTFTGTLTGMSASTTATVQVRRVGTRVRLFTAAGFTGTSNAATMTMTGVPAAYQPANLQTGLITVTDSASEVLGSWSISAGTITFTVGVLVLTAVRTGTSGTVFTASGTKGLPGGWCIEYELT